MYIDLPVGSHEASAEGMRKMWSDISKEYLKGKNSVHFTVVEHRPVYVRLDSSGQAGTRPTLVDAATAELEMAQLPLDTHFVSFKCLASKAEERGAQ